MSILTNLPWKISRQQKENFNALHLILYMTIEWSVRWKEGKYSGNSTKLTRVRIRTSQSLTQISYIITNILLRQPSMRILFGMFCSMDALILKQKEASLCSHQKKFRLKARIKKKNCQNGGYQFPKKIENIFLFYSSQNLNLRPSERNYTNKKTHQSQIDVTNFIFLLIILFLLYYFF